MLLCTTIQLTREQNDMARKMLDSHMAAIKNHIVSAIECGDDEYGKTGLTGITYAKELVANLRAHQELCHKFVPADMFDRYAKEA